MIFSSQCINTAQLSIPTEKSPVSSAFPADNGEPNMKNTDAAYAASLCTSLPGAVVNSIAILMDGIR